jgi:uncharacterized protein (TIGR02145 family)
MKEGTKIWIYSLITMGLILILSGSCSKKSDNTNPTPTGSTITDSDGNLYHAVTIGSQVWMVENLKTTKYNDGTAIPSVTDSSEWASLTTPGYCWYNNDAASYKTTYGALYNWYTVNTGKLCPTGWHIPSDAEWTTLTTYLGGDTLAGGKLKEAGTAHWSSPNVGASNQSGFTALPGGFRYYDGSFGNIRVWGNWWSSVEYSISSNAWFRALFFDYSNIVRDNFTNKFGLSVRCIKD